MQRLKADLRYVRQSFAHAGRNISRTMAQAEPTIAHMAELDRQLSQFLSLLCISGCIMTVSLFRTMLGFG